MNKQTISINNKAKRKVPNLTSSNFIEPRTTAHNRIEPLALKSRCTFVDEPIPHCPMPQQPYTAFVTTLSAIAGGLGKALATKPIFASITLFSLGTVAVYAALSAAVGYLVKFVMDWLKERHIDKGRKARKWTK